jgi:hypothetical protein
MSKMTPTPPKPPGLSAKLALPILMLPPLALLYWAYPEPTVYFFKEFAIFYSPALIAAVCVHRSMRNVFLIGVLSYVPLAVWIGYAYLDRPESFPGSLYEFITMGKYRPTWLLLTAPIFPMLLILQNHRSTLRQLDSVDPD